MSRIDALTQDFPRFRRKLHQRLERFVEIVVRIGMRRPTRGWLLDLFQQGSYVESVGVPSAWDLGEDKFVIVVSEMIDV